MSALEEEGDGRVGEATGEEGGGGSVAVRVALGGAAELASYRRGKGVGGGGVGKGLVIMLFGSPLIETKRVLGPGPGR